MHIRLSKRKFQRDDRGRVVSTSVCPSRWEEVALFVQDSRMGVRYNSSLRRQEKRSEQKQLHDG